MYGIPPPDEGALTDLPLLMQSLLAGAANSRGHPDGAGVARLLEAAAQALQQQVAEAKVQRGLAIASQTLAAELSVKCEQMQARLETVGQNGTGRVAHHDGLTWNAETTPAPTGAAPPVVPTPAVVSTPSAPAWTGATLPPSACASHHYAQPVAASPAAPPPSLHTQQQQLQQLQQLQAQQLQLQQQMHSQQMHAQHPPAQLPMQAAPAPTEPDTATRMGPRAFKTWTPDGPAPAAAGSHGGSGATAAGGYSGGGGGGIGGGGIGGGREDESAERAVGAMVDNLKQRFRQSGVTLPLEKHAGTVYRLGAKKLSLNIRSSRLMVRVGGGYCDFLEYLSKASI